MGIIMHSTVDDHNARRDLWKSLLQLVTMDKLIFDSPCLLAELNDQGAIQSLSQHTQSPVLLQALIDLCPIQEVQGTNDPILETSETVAIQTTPKEETFQPNNRKRSAQGATQSFSQHIQSPVLLQALIDLCPLQEVHDTNDPILETSETVAIQTMPKKEIFQQNNHKRKRSAPA
jgi:hypothetical protein